jgi:hypothetical protein
MKLRSQKFQPLQYVNGIFIFAFMERYRGATSPSGPASKHAAIAKLSADDPQKGVPTTRHVTVA